MIGADPYVFAPPLKRNCQNPLSRHAMHTWLGGILTYAAENYRDELMSYQQMWTSARHENDFAPPGILPDGISCAAVFLHLPIPMTGGSSDPPSPMVVGLFVLESAVAERPSEN
ncbi:MAG: hypothetical protein HRF51_06335 [bacterium]|jgi:hypothetical protein